MIEGDGRVVVASDAAMMSSEEDIKARFLHSTPQGDKSTASPVEADDLISHSYITGLVVNISFSLPSKESKLSFSLSYIW